MVVKTQGCYASTSFPKEQSGRWTHPIHPYMWEVKQSAVFARFSTEANRNFCDKLAAKTTLSPWSEITASDCSASTLSGNTPIVLHFSCTCRTESHTCTSTTKPIVPRQSSSLHWLSTVFVLQDQQRNHLSNSLQNKQLAFKERIPASLFPFHSHSTSTCEPHYQGRSNCVVLSTVR